jgi:hypothetical protein
VPFGGPASSDNATMIDLTRGDERATRPAQNVRVASEERFVVEWQPEDDPPARPVHEHGFTANVGISVFSG